MELKDSLEKLVRGVMKETTASWPLEKSSMAFCRSRMLRKKSLESSGAGLTVRAAASGGPPSGYKSVGRWAGGGGCRAKKAGTMMKKRQQARGRTATRVGFTHTKVYTKRKERVCVGCRQVNRRMARFCATKATPIRALKRRKLEDICGREKLGRSTYCRDRRSLVWGVAASSSISWGKTEESSLHT